MGLLALARSTTGARVSVSFAHPLLLVVVVLAALVVVTILTRVALGRSRVPHGRLWGALYAGSVVMLAVALGQPQVRTSARPPTVLVIDRSASVDATMRSDGGEVGLDRQAL